MASAGLTVAVGFVSGVLSGMFGIGGGVVTTPAIRWVLGAPALVAVGTPLPVILPSALTGALSYRRRGLIDLRSGLVIGAVGAAFSVFGAILATKVGGQVVLLLTGLLIVYMSVDMALQAIRGSSDAEPEVASDPDRGFGPGFDPRVEAATVPGSKPGVPALAAIGVLTGLYSGFLGLGGGFVLVPMLTRWFRLPIKVAIGTSLVAITLLSIPGSIAHWVLGNVDLHLAVLLVVGVVPGALVGARITFGASDRTMRIAFAVLLVAVGSALVLTESGVLR